VYIYQFTFPFPDKPICKPEQKRIYGIAKNEAVDIRCEVDAYPAPETFKWSFNNSAETVDMPQGYRKISSHSAVFTYKPIKVSIQPPPAAIFFRLSLSWDGKLIIPICKNDTLSN
jgi:hypothetical protein